MSSVVGHERRHATGHRRLVLVLLVGWMALTASFVPTTNAQYESVAERKREQVRFNDQQVLRSKSLAKPGGAELENICDVQTSLSLFCTCDSLNLQDATDARCSVFNVSDQNDSIWESFQTQTGLLDVQLNVQEHGQLNFLPAVALRNLPNLKSLQVREASIDTLVSQTFVDVTQLVELKLNRNKIRHIRPSAFEGLSRLVELEMSQNALNSLERGVFAGLVSLRLLYVDSNNISLVEDSVFQQMTQLEELDLSGNNIAVLTGETLIGLEQLKKLSLRGNRLAILGDNTFTYVPNLRRLDLSANQIQIIRNQALTGLRRLGHLNLAHNQLTGLDKAAFLPIWSNLLNNTMTFSMTDNPFQCDCRMQWIVRDLKKASSSTSLLTELDKLNCSVKDHSSKNLVSMLAVLDCHPTSTSQPAYKATVRPSRGSTTLAYVAVVEEEPATKKQPLMVNDSSSASLQLSSQADVRPQAPAASVATNTVPTDRPAQQSSASNFPSPLASIVSLFVVLLVQVFV